MELESRIRQARRQAALSQTALADRVGVNRSAVAQWERPRGSKPTSANLRKVAIATHVQFEWLATGRGRMLGTEASTEGDSPVLLNYFAHDEVEERVLLALRKIPYWQVMLLLEMAEGLAAGHLKD